MQAKTFSGFPTSDWSVLASKPVELMEGDLEEILDLQRSLMLECRADELPDDLLLYITLNNIIGESTEAAAFFGDITKPWKKSLGVSLDEVQEELIDILHFLLQAFIIVGMDASAVMELYRIKNRVNFRRIKAKREEAEGV